MCALQEIVKGILRVFNSYFFHSVFRLFFREGNDEERVRLYSESYDTKYAKSFRHFTREALPRMDNYRNIMSIHAAYRPTLDELHDATLHGKVSAHTFSNELVHEAVT